MFRFLLESSLFPKSHNCGRTGPVVAAGGGGGPRVGSSEGMKGGNVTGASNGQLEAVDVETLLVGVGQQPDKVVFLDAVGGEVGVKIAAGRPCNHYSIRGEHFFHWQNKGLSCHVS